MAILALENTNLQIELAGDLILAFPAGETLNCIGAKPRIDRNYLPGAGALVVSEPSSSNRIVAEAEAF